MRESTDDWEVEQMLVTLQQLPDISLLELTARIVDDLRDAYAAIRQQDPRWTAGFADIELIINPNGPLLNGGSDGDNGQTGRKLVMDYYGPRVPIGGGALSGKDLSHIDRAGAYAARHAALHAVRTGAGECRVTWPMRRTAMCRWTWCTTWTDGRSDCLRRGSVTQRCGSAIRAARSCLTWPSALISQTVASRGIRPKTDSC